MSVTVQEFEAKKKALADLNNSILKVESEKNVYVKQTKEILAKYNITDIKNWKELEVLKTKKEAEVNTLLAEIDTYLQEENAKLKEVEGLL